MVNFFQLKSTQSLINEYIPQIKSGYSDEFNENRNSFIKSILLSMKKNPDLWDKYTQFNIHHISEWIKTYLTEKSSNDSDLDTFLCLLFRFLMESHFYQPKELSLDLARVKDFMIYKKDSFEEDAQTQILYALYEMPFSLCREKYQNSDVQNFIDAARAEKVMKETMDTWDAKIKIQIGKVEKLKERLDEQGNAFNFVGLYRGFDDLSNKKKIESKRSFWFTLFLGILVLFPFSVDVFLVYKEVVKLDSILSLLGFIPAFTLTFIFIYYFRISLGNHMSVKSQVNQIELRKTLCSFIQKYSEYAKEMKANDGSSLDRFESVIFSNILSSENKIPSTFDGIDQIAKLIEIVKVK